MNDNNDDTVTLKLSDWEIIKANVSGIDEQIGLAMGNLKKVEEEVRADMLLLEQEIKELETMVFNYAGTIKRLKAENAALRKDTNKGE